jgi:hypothetical protein
MNEDPIDDAIPVEDAVPETYEKPTIEASSDVAGLLTFKGPKGPKGSNGGGPRNHS